MSCFRCRSLNEMLPLSCFLTSLTSKLLLAHHIHQKGNAGWWAFSAGAQCGYAGLPAWTTAAWIIRAGLSSRLEWIKTACNSTFGTDAQSTNKSVKLDSPMNHACILHNACIFLSIRWLSFASYCQTNSLQLKDWSCLLVVLSVQTRCD